MKNKILFVLIFVTIASLCNAAQSDNDFNHKKLDFNLNSTFGFQNKVKRYSKSEYGNVASDKEAIKSETFHLFKTFRNASIGMFVPGTLFGGGSIIAVTTLYCIATTIEGVSGSISATNTMTALSFYLPGFYSIMAFGIISAIFLVCGTAFAISAGVMYYKWAKSRQIASFNAVDGDKPMFAQGFAITL